jgi:hypothetical protein
MRCFKTLLIFVLLAACEREMPTPQAFPVLETIAVSDIGETGATFHAEIINEGTAAKIEYGFVWDISDPRVESAATVIVNDESGNIVSARVESSLVKNVEYTVRAYALYDGKIAYGNAITFLSQGSLNNGWGLRQTGLKLNGSFGIYGTANIEQGFILFQTGELNVFNGSNNAVTASTKFPIQGHSQARFSSGSDGIRLYVNTNLDDHLYVFEDGTWRAMAELPDGFINHVETFVHVTGGKVFLLSLFQSYAYDLASGIWQAKAAYPESTNQFTELTALSSGANVFLLGKDKRLWEYHTDTDTWTSSTSFPGTPAPDMVTFTSGDKIYFGLGHNVFDRDDWLDNELWSFNRSNNQWKLQQLFPVEADGSQIAYFSLDGKLFVVNGFGVYNVWVYDPEKDLK